MTFQHVFNTIIDKDYRVCSYKKVDIYVKQQKHNLMYMRYFFETYYSK